MGFFFFFFQHFKHVIPLLSVFCCFYEKLAVNCIVVSLYVVSHSSLTAFKIFFLSLAFNSLNRLHLSADILPFILLRVCWVSWICRLIFSLNIGHFQPLFLKIVSAHFLKLFFSSFLFLLSFETLIKCMLGCLILLHRSLRLCSFFLISFLCYSD